MERVTSHHDDQPRRLRLFLLITGFLFTALHAYAAFSPTAANWGYHHLGFFPLSLSLPTLGLMFVMLIPRASSYFTTHLQNLTEQTAKLMLTRGRLFVVLLVIALIVLFWVGRQATHFLGDGYLWLTSVEGTTSMGDIASNYPNAPLVGLLYFIIHHAFTPIGIHPAALITIQTVSIFFGTAMVLVILLLVRSMVSLPVDRLLAGLFIVVSGSIQLAFGYIETYTPTACMVLVYLFLAVRFLEGKTKLLLPALAYGVLFTFHFGMLWLAPSLMVLVLRELRNRRYGSVISAFAGTIALISLLLWPTGYTPRGLLEHLISKSGSQWIPITAANPVKYAYGLFDAGHFIDLANLFMLLSPFAAVLFIPRSVRSLGSGRSRDPSHQFLIVTGMCGLLFIVLTNFEIGMSRDWDLTAPYFLGIIIAALYLWYNDRGSPHQRRNLMFSMVVLMLLHTIFWVVLNAQEERSIRRFTMLPDSSLWSRSAYGYAYEDLSVYYRERGNRDEAIRYSTMSVEAEPLHARRWFSLGGLYESAGRKTDAISAYERALVLGSDHFTLYVNLGLLYADMGRSDDALRHLLHGFERNPDSAPIAHNIGAVLLAGKGDPGSALPYFLRAIELDPNLPDPYFSAGAIEYNNGRYGESIRLWNIFLRIAPNHPRASEVRTILESLRR